MAAARWLSISLSLFLFGMNASGQAFFSLKIGSSPNPVGSGARALGQGNAFIAVADDATAASWNPGGLAQLQSTELSFAVEATQRREHINSNSNPESETASTFGFEDFNYVSLVQPFFYKRNMVFSLNYLTLLSFDKEFQFPTINVSRRGTRTERQIDFDQDGQFSVIAPALGIQVTDKLAIGLTFNIWNDDLTSSSSYDEVRRQTGTFSRDELRGDFQSFDLNRFTVEDGYSFVFGGMYRLNKQWTLGGVIKPAFTMDIDHFNQIFDVQTGDFGVVLPEDNPVPRTTNSELEQPWIIGLGTAWRPIDHFTVSMDVTWTDWSGYVFTERGLDRNPVSGRPINEDELDDTYTVRFGNEYLWILDTFIIPFRWGIGYDPGPAVGKVDDFYTVSIGTGAQIHNRLSIDIAYEFRWGNNVNTSFLREISGSQDVNQHRTLASLIYFF